MCDLSPPRPLGRFRCMIAQNDRLDTGNVMEEKKLKKFKRKNFRAEKPFSSSIELSKQLNDFFLIFRWLSYIYARNFKAQLSLKNGFLAELFTRVLRLVLYSNNTRHLDISVILSVIFWQFVFWARAYYTDKFQILYFADGTNRLKLYRVVSY